MKTGGSWRTLIAATLFAAAFWTWPAAAAEADDEPKSYSFAVVPQFDPRRLFTVWRPILDDLERRTGLRLHLNVTLTTREFEHAIVRGDFDFIYTNLYHIYRQREHQGYIPLVRDVEPLRGILVVRRDSPVRTVAELNGKTLAVPSANATGASLLLRADLATMGVKMEMRDVKTHTSVYLHVANGLTDAGGGVEKTLAEQPQQVRDAVRVLHVTPGIPAHPIAAHPRVPAAVRERLRKALLELAATPEGKRMLAEVPINKLVATSEEDYRQLESVGIESFWIEGKE